MKNLILTLALLASIAGFASTNQDASEVIDSLDTTESWGMGDRNDKKDHHYYYYKCCARPQYKKHSFEAQFDLGTNPSDNCDDNMDSDHNKDKCYWGDSKNMQDAKWEALKECQYKTGKHCYIKGCKKYKK